MTVSMDGLTPEQIKEQAKALENNAVLKSCLDGLTANTLEAWVNAGDTGAREICWVRYHQLIEIRNELANAIKQHAGE